MPPAWLGILLLAAGVLPARAFELALPTGNRALLDGDPAAFYMHVDRNFEGRKTTPWEGGSYGFVRGPQRIGGRVLLTHFHEGIDIAPLHRDAKGEPLDDVKAIAPGRVVHVSRSPRASNYGIYVVVQHEIESSPVYSTYAHLAEVSVQTGQELQTGDRIGRLGYTGEGLDRRRAHLHLEFGLMLHDDFEDWHAARFTSPNLHGVHNGMNFLGLDLGRLYVEKARNPGLTLPEFLQGETPFFKVRLPAGPEFQLPRRYPWLVRPSGHEPRSWIATFNAIGFPLSFEASPTPVAGPELLWVRPSKVPVQHLTRRLLSGLPPAASLGPQGHKFLELLTWTGTSSPSEVSSLPSTP